MPRHTNWAKTRAGSEQWWTRTVRPREEFTIDMAYHFAKMRFGNPNNLFIDISKSYEHGSFRFDGFVPPLFGLVN